VLNEAAGNRGDLIPPFSVNTRAARKLCACGRSQAFPFCDNSHQAEGWNCTTSSTWARIGFCASDRYQNLARKLASHYQGAIFWPGGSLPAVDQLVTIVDGMDLELVLAMNRAIQARARMVITLGVPGGLLHELFSGCQVFDLGRIDLLAAFKQVVAIVDSGQGPAAPLSAVTMHTGFISHAVADEALLLPIVDYLRRYFAVNLFVCADSILPGTDWQETIQNALVSVRRKKPVF
jgi:CDGSH-type Zn-finger protein